MPPRRSAKTGFKRKKPMGRTNRYAPRKRRNQVIRTTIPKAPKGAFTMYNDVSPLPLTMRTKFVYNAESILTTLAGFSTVGTEYKWVLNSAYDPYDGTLPAIFNASCNGYTNLLTANGPYKRYKVNGVLIDVMIFDPDGTDSDSTELVAAVKNANDAATYTLVGVTAQSIEASQWGVIKRVSDSGSQRRRFKQYFPMNVLFGWTAEQFRSEMANTTAPYNDSPASKPRLFIGLANRRAAATATTAIVKVRLTFYTTLYDRALNAA